MIREKLQKTLNCRFLYVLLLLIAATYVLISFSIERNSILSDNDQEFTGILKKLTVSDGKIKFTISQGGEDLICNYYLEEDIDPVEYINKYKIGSLLEIKGVLKKPINNTILNTFNYQKYLYYHNTFYTCTVEKVFIKSDKTNVFYSIKNAIIKRIMSFKIRDYMYTMIIGDKSFLDEETYENFQKNGVTHLFAISGMHVGLFSLFLLKLFKKLGEKKRYIAVIAFIWFYAFLAGFASSIIRSALLFSLISIFKILNIKVSTLKVLLLTGFILVIIDPFIIMDIGFIYSFVTTFGLIYSNSFLTRHKIIGTSLIANFYSLPITINNFFKVNFLSVFFNIIFVPFVSVIIYPLCLITFVFRFLEPLTSLSIFFLELINTLSSKIDFLYLVIPKLPLVVIIIYYVILTKFIHKKPLFVLVLLVGMIIGFKFSPLFDNHYHVEFLDVGQGDSTLIRSKHNSEVILIDTGGLETYGSKKSNYHVASKTITYLNSLGIEKIDLLVLTHGDMDHLGDALYLIENFRVKEVMINKGEINEKEQEILNSKAKVTDKYSGSLDLKFLNDLDWGNENSNSIVTSLKIYDTQFLFMGDADKKVEKYILERENKLEVDVLKIGHHGSKTSSDEKFLKSLKVKMGIISAGRENRYNHPSPETLDTLGKLHIPYMSTQYDGTISYKINSKSVTYDRCFP